MKWYKNLYLGETIKKKASRIKWKVEHNVGQLSVYLLTLPCNKENLLEIIPAAELVQKAYPKKDIYVIGIECSFDDAAVMAASVIQEVYAQTGTFDVAGYIHKQDREA